MCHFSSRSEKTLSFSPINVMLMFLYMVFIMFRYVTSIHNLASVCHDGMSNFIACFFFINWDDDMIFSFIMLWCFTFLDLHIMNYSCIPEFHLLVSCWGFLNLYSSRILAYSFLFFCCCCVLVWYVYQGNISLAEWIWENSLLFYFLK